jgi:hypothetical protein
MGLAVLPYTLDILKSRKIIVEDYEKLLNFLEGLLKEKSE